jgi:hypothetical protein
MMDNRQIGTYVSRFRVGLGLAAIAAPRLTYRVALGPVASERVTSSLGRLTGVREAVIGAGGSISLGERAGGANWLSMSAIVDAVDSVVLLTTPGLARRARLIGVGAAGFAVAQLYLAREIAAEERVET